MTDRGASYQPMTREEAAARLAQLVNRELGTDTNSNEILTLFDKYWDRLSMLAHHIHRDSESERARRQAQMQLPPGIGVPIR